MNQTCLVVAEMGRFFCFSTKIHYHRSKKEIPHTESMSKASEEYSDVQESKASRAPSPEQDTSLSIEKMEKPSEMHSESSSESYTRVDQKTGLKRSQSLSCALDREERLCVSEDERDGEIKDFSPDSFQGVPNETIFLIGGYQANSPPGGYDDASGHHAPGALSVMEKSCSLPHISVSSPASSKDGSSLDEGQLCHCRSLEDLSDLNEKNKASQNHGVEFDTAEYQDGTAKDKPEDPLGERYEFESGNYPGSKNWDGDEINVVREDRGDSSALSLDALPSNDFKTQLIEEWVSAIAIELEESSPLQNIITESHHSTSKAKRGSLLGSSSLPKLDSKIIHGMEAAKNYVSSLPPAATSAQLVNLGLVAIPFLSAFVHLKTLNLSGNAIVRITSGTLPRGLHALNLSKNNISCIEGLRELTRLRVVDLSYNRIVRIGHGLASCSSLKELYLAGNKISEVEGLHRLLKLNILDLRFNKISTAKCLGQLAANYSCLQAIKLEGNPAQRNIGDEQLKKYLQNCLPHLVYYNKQTIKASEDRGLRVSEHNLVRKSNVSAGKASSSSHGHRVQAVALTKPSKDRHGRLPPNGTRGAHAHHHHYLELGSKPSDSSMRRTQSEGNLGTL